MFRTNKVGIEPADNLPEVEIRKADCKSKPEILILEKLDFVKIASNILCGLTKEFPNCLEKKRLAPSEVT
jgi:hypothetical protein